MKVFVAVASLALASGAAASERVRTAEGWYQVEGGFGETDESEIFLAVAPEDPVPAAAPSSSQQLQAAPSPEPFDRSTEAVIARAGQLDCDEVRGRYLQRILELHGVNVFALHPRDLAAWTRHRPASSVAWGFGAGLGEPALAPLFGEPPVPPGALGFDLTLQRLGIELLSCDARAAGLSLSGPAVPAGSSAAPQP